MVIPKIDRFRLAQWITAFGLVIFILPYLILGHHTYVRLHDTLEGEWVWLTILCHSGHAFGLGSHVAIPQVMNGLLRDAFPVGWSFNLFLVRYLGTLPAYIGSGCVIHIMAFVSMSLLLRTYYLPSARSRYIVWFAALTFAVLPFFVPFGLTVAGQPLALWAFLNLRRGKQLGYSYLVVALFPFYSSLVWFPVPFAIIVVAVGLYYLYKRAITWHYAWGLIIMAVGFVVANFSMLSLAFFNHDFVSHREAYNIYMGQSPSWQSALGDTLLNFFIVHYHVGNFLPIICLIAVLLTAHRTRPLLTAIIIIITASAVFQGFYSLLEYHYIQYIPMAKSLRINRLSILIPFLWILVYALALDRMDRNKLLRPLIIPFVLLQLLIGLLGNDEILHNYRILAGFQKFPAFDNYLAKNQFDAIASHIGKPKSSYRVASFAMSPSIAQYNGFYTLDGLFSIYGLDYKKQFRKVFAGEIDKSPAIHAYFDGWGNRCYLYSAELGIDYTAFNCYKSQHRSVHQLAFDSAAFAAMGGEYLLSAVPIENHDAVGLDLDGVFDDSISWWRVYLYHVKPAAP